MIINCKASQSPEISRQQVQKLPPLPSLYPCCPLIHVVTMTPVLIKPAEIVSNGWGDATAALQLLSHLQDDALSVALLIPMPLRASRKELTDALSSHYGSPGRLANYRREFDKTVRKRGEDPSNFAITLETLADKAFGNMGQTSRLRLIRDRFIAGHESCDLRRYLDCVPPDTPLRDIVDRCRVWESHGNTEVRRVSKPMPEPVYPTYVVEQPD